MKRDILTGRTFGRLTVLSDWDRKNSSIRWHCLCECGNERMVFATALKRGSTKSCGCISIDTPARLVHGHAKRGSHSTEHRSWESAKARCYNKKNARYHSHGARGITMCDQWIDNFQQFLADMGPCPDGKSIDRIDNNGNYEPGNCRWATDIEQANNLRRTRFVIKPDGNKTTIGNLSRETGLKYTTLMRRHVHNWSYERLVSAVS